MISKTRLKQLARLEGLLYEGEGERLAELAAEVPDDLAIVEIGSYKGKSSCYLAEGAKRGGGAHVWCVDPWDLPGNPTNKVRALNSPETHLAFIAQVAKAGLSDRITPIKAFSVDVAKNWQRPVGLIFIDGNHGRLAVKADYVAWRPHLADEAIVVFHDYAPTKNIGVRRFVDRLLTGERRLEAWEFGPGTLAIARRCL